MLIVLQFILILIDMKEINWLLLSMYECLRFLCKKQLKILMMI